MFSSAFSNKAAVKIIFFYHPEVRTKIALTKIIGVDEQKKKDYKRSLIMIVAKTCMPRRAKMKMKRKRRRRRERMEEMALVKASTRFLRLDQYLIQILS